MVIKKRKDLKMNILNKINPKIIFFPHWSFLVPEKIIKSFMCVCFHTAPLPYGRGGSPIQNLIKRGFKNAPLCAIKMVNKIDSGPIYLNEKVSLKGNLDEIFFTLSRKILNIMKKLSKKKYYPKAQKGKIVKFNRLKKNDSKLRLEQKLSEICDKIRMLDGEDYPRAYLENKNFKFEFTNAKMKKNSILCNAKITKYQKK